MTLKVFLLVRRKDIGKGLPAVGAGKERWEGENKYQSIFSFPFVFFFGALVNFYFYFLLGKVSK